MPIEVRRLSVSQFCELTETDEARFNGVQMVWTHTGFTADGNKTYRREIAIYQEPIHADTRDESAALSGQRHEEKAQGRQEGMLNDGINDCQACGAKGNTMCKVSECPGAHYRGDR
jgi:hypothetical protein